LEKFFFFVFRLFNEIQAFLNLQLLGLKRQFLRKPRKLLAEMVVAAGDKKRKLGAGAAYEA
jgi:hypothetical protein